mmetsp:Transcript_10509/g.22809  ORF Transcript_10509/g.22809 Transcript_10509/m.22809 type:complete len:208 (+) Transcript_10509:104-727(+)
MMTSRLIARSRTVLNAARPRLTSCSTPSARPSSAYAATTLRTAGGSESQRRTAHAVLISATVAATLAAASADRESPTLCHCQVPCGIFDDPVRVALIKEHAATIRKAVSQINNLAGESPEPQDFNQAARWIAVKEEAASGIIDIVSTYMLCQRVKKASFETREEYLQALELHHILMQAAMLSKQTVSTTTCDALDKAVAGVGAMYTK